MAVGFQMDPDAEDQRKIQMEKMESDLKKRLASARTADFGLANDDNTERLKQIVADNQPVKPEIEKMSETEAEALRQSGKKQQSAIVKQQQKVAGFMGWLSSIVVGLFSGKGNHQSQCEIYGHNIPYGQKWDGPFPRCKNCNIEITTPDMLRTATPKRKS